MATTFWSKRRPGIDASESSPSATAPRRTARGWCAEAVITTRSNQSAPAQLVPGGRSRQTVSSAGSTVTLQNRLTSMPVPEITPSSPTAL
jgi:hypothetical protein